MSSFKGADPEQLGNISEQERKRSDETMGQFQGPVESSPFYKALLTTGREGTSNAYEAAKSNVKSRAKAAGFGESSPVAQGAEGEVEAREAQTMGGLPARAAAEAAPLTERAGETAGREGLGYMGLDVGLTEEQLRQQAALWQAIAGVGSAGIEKGGAFNPGG